MSSQEDFLKLLAECSGSLPPIRGAVNSAMVLDDTVLERMTWEQWNRATQAKIATSMNLHLFLPDLEFLVHLSSVTGVAGHISQANYAAGNAFQDALARYRTVRGQPAVALDLGAVESVGFVAQQDLLEEENSIRRRVENLGAASVSAEAVLQLVEATIMDPLRTTPAKSQVVVGFGQFVSISDSSFVKTDRRFGTLRLGTTHAAVCQAPGGDSSTTASGPKDSLAILLATIADMSWTSQKDLTHMVANTMTSKLGTIFNVEPDDIDRDLPLSQYGVDSLVAVDLRNWLSGRLKARVSVSDINQASSIPSLASLVAARCEMVRDGSK